jgi:hypothetical protein
MTAWQTALAAYLGVSLLTAALLGQRLASIRRRYPLIQRPRSRRERRSLP